MIYKCFSVEIIDFIKKIMISLKNKFIKAASIIDIFQNNFFYKSKKKEKLFDMNRLWNPFQHISNKVAKFHHDDSLNHLET